jgi:hypothetical protein
VCCGTSGCDRGEEGKQSEKVENCEGGEEEGSKDEYDK